MPEDCIFCKIIAGEIPCTRVYEDDACLAFMDIGPLADGHTLLVPKKHYEVIGEMPPDEVAHLGRQIPGLARAVQEAMGADGLNVGRRPGLPLAGRRVRPRDAPPPRRRHPRQTGRVMGGTIPARWLRGATAPESATFDRKVL